MVENEDTESAFNRFMTSAKPFYVTDDCIGCKRCERICPVGNVVVIGWRPVWGWTVHLVWLVTTFVRSMQCNMGKEPEVKGSI